MAKVTRTSGRGTKKRTTDAKKKSTFSGDSYKEYQAAKKKAAGNRSVTTGRGTGRRKLRVSQIQKHELLQKVNQE